VGVACGVSKLDLSVLLSSSPPFFGDGLTHWRGTTTVDKLAPLQLFPPTQVSWKCSEDMSQTCCLSLLGYLTCLAHLVHLVPSASCLGFLFIPGILSAPSVPGTAELSTQLVAFCVQFSPCRSP
jgi:hypothetical protein